MPRRRRRRRGGESHDVRARLSVRAADPDSNSNVKSV